MDLFLKLKNEFERFIEKGDKILVCVSGGPDSVVLLNILNKLKKEKNLKLYVAHFNHKLRGIESFRDAEFVRSLASQYNNKFFYKEKNIKKLIKIKDFGPEKTAREERYRFFVKQALKNKISKIFLAHNRDDNVETILFRFIKGAGADGLTGIPRIRQINYGNFGLKEKKLKQKKIFIVRPLLKISREEILEYIKINNLKFRVDKTNKENIFVRNKIRNKLIPFIEKNFNPGFKNTVANISDILTIDNDFMESVCNKYEKKIILRKKIKEVIISLTEYKKMHIAIRFRFIKNILKYILTRHRKITYTLIKNIDDAIWKGKKMDLPYGYKCHIEKQKIIIKK